MTKIASSTFAWFSPLLFALALWQADCVIGQDKDSAPGKGGETLASQVMATATALENVADVESAKKAAPSLAIWRELPFQTDDPAEAELLQARIAGDPALQEAMAAFGGQMQRISQLDSETFAIVAEALTGNSPIDLKQHIGELTKAMKTVQDLASAKAAVSDLEKWGQPAFEVIEKNADRLNEQFAQDQELQQIFQAYGVEVQRINQLGDEIAQLVRYAAVGKERSERMVRNAEEAAARAPLLKTKSLAMQIRTALTSYFTEYRRHPWQSDSGEDLLLSSDGDFHKVLAGEDLKRNPRQITFLTLPDDAIADDGSIVDIWGKPFRVFLDTDFDSLLSLPVEYGKGLQLRSSIALDSAGADGKFETTEDNVTSWQEPGQ